MNSRSHPEFSERQEARPKVSYQATAGENYRRMMRRAVAKCIPRSVNLAELAFNGYYTCDTCSHVQAASGACQSCGSYALNPHAPV